MLVPLLLCALVKQSISIPTTDCNGPCESIDNQQSTNNRYGGHRSYSSHYKSSFGSTVERRNGGYAPTTRQLANLENFDQHSITNNDNNEQRPGNWNEEKHYRTDDGRGQLSYKQGQVVSDSGITKYASHNYQYSSHDTQPVVENAQVLNANDFENEFQRIKSTIGNFNRNFRFNSASLINENIENDFKTQAELIRNQVNDICNQINTESSMYLRMQDMLKQFNENVARKETAMQRFITDNSRSFNQYTEVPSYTSNLSPYTSNVPIRSRIEDEEFQRLKDSYRTVQSSVSNFYKQFNKLTTETRYIEDLNNKVNEINSLITNFRYNASRDSSMILRIDNLKDQFDKYVSQLRSRIDELLRRQKENLSDVSPITSYPQPTNYPTRTSHYDYQYDHQQKQTNDNHDSFNTYPQGYTTTNNYETRPINQNYERTNTGNQKNVNQNREQNIGFGQSLHQKDDHFVSRVIPLNFDHHSDSQVRIEQGGSSTVIRPGNNQRYNNNHGQLQLVNEKNVESEQSIQSPNYGTTYEPNNVQSSSSISTHSSGTQNTNKLSPYVDMTALTGKLQQDLHRLENEMNNFVSQYTMRMTATNSDTVGKELEHMANNIRNKINKLCERTETYQTNALHESAENLNRRFSEQFKEFTQRIENFHKGGYSDSLSYGLPSSNANAALISSSSSSSSLNGNSQVIKPVIKNIEYEHEKTVEIETSRGSPQRYSSSSSYSSRGTNNQELVKPIENHESSGYSHSSSSSSSSDSRSSQYRSYGSSNHGRLVDCVEQYSGQPCINQSSSQRYKKNINYSGN